MVRESWALAIKRMGHDPQISQIGSSDVVAIMVQESTGESSGASQCSRSPAKANGRPSRILIQ